MLSVPEALSAQNTKLIIRSGSTLTVAGNNLVLNNTDLRCDGALNASNATLLITGSHNTSFSGARTPLIREWILNTSSSDTLTLYDSVKVSNALDLKSGLIDLNGNVIKLTGSAVLKSESETCHIIDDEGGMVTASATAVLNPNQLNIGNLGAVLTTSANLGNITVSRSHKPATNPGNSSFHGIQRTFLIQPQHNSALHATLRFYYLNAELNGDNPNTLSLWKSSDGITWVLVGADSRNTVSKYVEKTGLADLSYWTLTDATKPLLHALTSATTLTMTTLTSFKAICKDQSAILQWQTGTESNTDHFVIQRSAGPDTWLDLGEIEASGNTNGSAYTYKDPHPLAASSYCLKIVDRSGNFSYSPVFQGGCSDIALPFMVYPNPSQTQAVAKLSVREASTATIQLLDMGGRLLYSSPWSLQPGINQFILSVSRFPAGTYIVKLLLTDNILQTKIIKQ
jgi:hypothetical protein